MAQDFAKRRQTAKKTTPRKKNTRKAPAASASAGSHWSWFFTGLFSGLFFAFVAYLAMVRPGTPGEPVASSSTEAVSEGESRSAGREFDFYEYLPEAEVSVDVVPVDTVRQAPEEDNAQYLLQAGSFQSRDDAENRRAKVILLNYSALIEPGVVSGKTWHRVQVGPFTGRSTAEEARDALSSNNIDTIVLRMK